jgi:hypothetical protein
VFAHGNHDPLKNSTPGYLYLCQLLASHGIIAATTDVNFLHRGNFGENGARAIVHLEPLRQFRTWNETAAHPLNGKVDLNRILIVGHFRGGERVDTPPSSIDSPRFSPTSTEVTNGANRDQDFTLEVSSSSRTAAIPASSLHRLLYPDVVFGAGKIVMQTSRLPVERLIEAGVDPSNCGLSRSFSIGDRLAWSM